MKIDVDVRSVATFFGVDPALLQAVVLAEGDIVRAVRCSWAAGFERATALASVQLQAHNGVVKRRGVQMVALARVLVVVTSVATGSFADFRSSTAAMACCAKTHGQCAGLSTPDDCCKQMGHATGAGIAGMVSAAHPHVLPSTGVVAWLPADLALTRDSSSPNFAFKRPHDPPHLHSFSLLI